MTAPVFEDVVLPGKSRTPVEPPARTQHDHPAGTEIDLIEPGTDAWYEVLSASKISALTGTSPWDSAYAIWHRMKQLTPRPEVTGAMMRGHLLEPAVADWFQLAHPNWTVRTCGTYVHHAQPRFTAAPDRIVTKPDVNGAPDLLEVKSTTMDHEWGTPGTDQIPDHYRDQVIWQMHVTGASRCHVAVIGSFLEFAEYVVDYDPAHAARLEAAGTLFLELLDTNTPPSIDSHGATFDAVRELHPTVTKGVTVDATEDLARRYVNAINGCKTADSILVGVKTEIFDLMGDANTLLYKGATLATRRPSRPGALPSIYAAKKLPDLDAEAAAAHLEARTAWLVDRVAALKADNPEMVPMAGERWRATGIAVQPPWTDDEITRISDVLHSVEQAWPADDPARPPAPIIAPPVELPALQPITDDGTMASDEDIAGIRAAIKGMAEDDHKIATLTHWAKQGRNGSRPWDSTEAMTVRCWTIARAALRFLQCVGADDNRLRMTLGYVIGDDLQPAWSTGAVLGSLTTDQANELAQLSEAYRAKDTTVRAVIDAAA